MINSYQKGQIILDKVKSLGYKPKLLLHSCCGPCSTYPIEVLNNYFDITILFNNSNIYPLDEYNHRLNTLKEYIDIYNKENKSNVKIVEYEYNYDSYIKKLEIRKDDLENGPRCKLCYYMRLNQVFEYASKNYYEYVGTVMSMSRQKDEQSINKVGIVLEKKYPNIKFLIHNFKKKGGQERRDYLVDKYNLYDQIYCGCEYSKDNKKLANKR